MNKLPIADPTLDGFAPFGAVGMPAADGAPAFELADTNTAAFTVCRPARPARFAA